MWREGCLRGVVTLGKDTANYKGKPGNKNPSRSLPSLLRSPSRTLSCLGHWKSQIKRPVEAVLPGQTPEQQAARTGGVGEQIPSS